EMLHLVAAHGDPDAVKRLRELGPIHVQVGGVFEPILRGERVVHIADVRETDTYRDNPAARERFELREIRTWLAVALRKEGALLGAIIVHSREVRRFAEVVREPTRPEPGSVHERLLRGEHLIHIPDMAEFPAIRPVGRAAVEAGSRTVLIVPLRKDAALLGYITAHRKEIRPFSEKE